MSYDQQFLTQTIFKWLKQEASTALEQQGNKKKSDKVVSNKMKDCSNILKTMSTNIISMNLTDLMVDKIDKLYETNDEEQPVTKKAKTEGTQHGLYASFQHKFAKEALNKLYPDVEFLVDSENKKIIKLYNEETDNTDEYDALKLSEIQESKILTPLQINNAKSLFASKLFKALKQNKPLWKQFNDNFNKLCNDEDHMWSFTTEQLLTLV